MYVAALSLSPKLQERNASSYWIDVQQVTGFWRVFLEAVEAADKVSPLNAS
jgi:hypothetical protein